MSWLDWIVCLVVNFIVWVFVIIESFHRVIAMFLLVFFEFICWRWSVLFWILWRVVVIVIFWFMMLIYWTIFLIFSTLFLFITLSSSSNSLHLLLSITFMTLQYLTVYHHYYYYCYYCYSYDVIFMSSCTIDHRIYCW